MQREVERWRDRRRARTASIDVAPKTDHAPSAESLHEKSVLRRQSPPRRVRPQGVVIGCSTGGPAGLTTVLESLVVPLDIPIFAVQHMPPKFTKSFADNLNNRVETSVVEAEDGMIAEGGTCYIAPGGLHLELRRNPDDQVILATVDSEPVTFCKPSVERLFSTAADVFRHRVLVVMMTGMGRDGVHGTARLAELGCPVIAQDEESSVVWGMPGAVVGLGAASEVLHLDEIGARIAHIAVAG